MQRRAGHRQSGYLDVPERTPGVRDLSRVRLPAAAFSLRDPCCQARIDFTAKVPEGTTKEQFQRMLQNLLVERFKLTLHHEMAIYELTVGEKGPKMRESAPERPRERKRIRGSIIPHIPWANTVTRCSRPAAAVWPGQNVSVHLGRPVVDGTGLRGKYDIDMTWTLDLAWIMEGAGLRDRIA